MLSPCNIGLSHDNVPGEILFPRKCWLPFSPCMKSKKPNAGQHLLCFFKSYLHQHWGHQEVTQIKCKVWSLKISKESDENPLSAYVLWADRNASWGIPLCFQQSPTAICEPEKTENYWKITTTEPGEDYINPQYSSEIPDHHRKINSDKARTFYWS